MSNRHNNKEHYDAWTRHHHRLPRTDRERVLGLLDVQEQIKDLRELELAYFHALRGITSESAVIADDGTVIRVNPLHGGDVQLLPIPQVK